MKRVLKICVASIMFLTGCLLLFVVAQILKAPDLSEADASPEGYMTTILDNNEAVVDTLYVTESNRIYVELDEIPKDLQEAFIAIEDSRFYSHHGFDTKGLIRAFVHGLKNGGFTQGGSTITQQLLKNNVFTDWMEEETFYDKVSRKVQELYLSTCLERQHSKEWILENYLNTINLGGGTRGVQVASQYYFGKDVSELTLAESALIAGITKNPTKYNPFRNPEVSMERQRLVLDAMLREEFISQEEYDQAAAEDVMSVLQEKQETSEQKVFSWFEDALLEQVVADLMKQYGYDEDTAWNMIYSGGLTIYSTQDTRLQEVCEQEALHSEGYGAEGDISIVMTDVNTGAVAAIVGSGHEKTSSLVYNRATESKRQPGSTIKVIGEYAAALDLGKITLGTAVNDEPYAYSNGQAIHNASGRYFGMTTIRDSIASSGNIVALKTFQMLGGDCVYGYLQKFGITTLEADEAKNEALAIGGTHEGVTNLELTGAYTAIANDGMYIRPYFYTKVLDRDGQVVLKNHLEYTQAVKQETAQLLTSALQDVILYGTGKDAAVTGVDLAGKSGSTNGNVDLWFVGFSSKYACGIWGGRDDNEPQNNGAYVKKIWQAVMESAHRGVDTEALVDTQQFERVLICKKCGHLAVRGVCNDTVQGDMAYTEYYANGTAPKESCDCHVSVKICKESGKQSGKYCPTFFAKKDTYLKTASEGTEDMAYVVPGGLEETCDVHKNIFDEWIDDTPIKDWWDNLFQGIF